MKGPCVDIENSSARESSTGVGLKSSPGDNFKSAFADSSSWVFSVIYQTSHHERLYGLNLGVREGGLAVFASRGLQSHGQLTEDDHAPTSERFYIPAGTLPRNASSYILRAADDALFNALREGEFCYTLTSRQMGKSSLMVRTVDRLRAVGTSVVILDLTRFGSNLDAEQWYNGLIEQLGERLDLREETEVFARENEDIGPLHCWLAVLSRIALPHAAGPLVIFFDEIDFVRSLPFSTDEFFAAIRACYNARVEEAAFERLTFCLLGVATPSELIDNPRLTPFNIGTRIHLHDFTADEVSLLHVGLGRDTETNRLLMQRILFWTGGHPCLTQRLCKAVAEDERIYTPSGVDSCCKRLFMESRIETRDDNIEFVQKRLLGDSEQEAAGLLTLYERVWRGARVEDDETIPRIAQLKLSGAVRVAGGRLQVRNRIYERVFNQTWVRNNLPGAELRRQKAAFRGGLIRASSIAAAVLAVVTTLSVVAVVQAHRADISARAARAQTRRALVLLYEADMGLIVPAYEHNDFRRMRRLLEETRDNPNWGFEWGYWNRLCHLDTLTLEGHAGGVYAAAFSPDGRRIATNNEDGTVHVWNAQTGQDRFALQLQPPKGALKKPWPSHQRVSYSPGGRRILGQSHVGRVWDAETGRELMPVMGHDGVVDVDAFSTDWRRMISMHWNPPAIVEIRRAATGETIATLGLKQYVSSASFSPDGSRVIIGTGDGMGAGTVWIWDTVTGRLAGNLKGHKGDILSLAYSLDGHKIVSSGFDRTVRVWDAATTRPLLTLTGHTDGVNSAYFSRDGRWILTGSEDRTAKLWDVVTGTLLATIRGHDDGLYSADFSWDGRRIVTSSRDGTAKVWNVSDLGAELTLAGHAAAVGSAVFSPDGAHLITCSDDHIAKVWDVASTRELFTLKGHRDGINSAAFSADGHRIVTFSTDRTTRVWNTANGRELMTLKGHTNEVDTAVFSPDGQRILTAGKDATARVLDAASGRELLTLTGHKGQIYSAVFSADGMRILTGSSDQTARIWDANSGRLLLTLEGHRDKIYSVAFSPDGRRIVTGSKDKTARIWNAETGREILTIDGPEARVYSVQFSPDGRRILTASGLTAQLWDANTGRELLALKGHKSTVFSAAFSPDGRRIVTSSADHTAKIWLAD